MTGTLIPKKKTWSKNAWDQLRNIVKDVILNNMRRDPNWTETKSNGARIAFHNPKYKPPYDICTVHYHPHATYDRKTLKDMLDHICWDEATLKRLKIIK